MEKQKIMGIETNEHEMKSNENREWARGQIYRNYF